MTELVEPRIQVPPSEMVSLGELALGGEVGWGGAIREAVTDLPAGRWRARAVTETLADELMRRWEAERGRRLAFEEYPVCSLLLEHERCATPLDPAALRLELEYGIDGALFVLLDADAWHPNPALRDDVWLVTPTEDDLPDFFSEATDGVFRGGRGVRLLFRGDGFARVFVTPERDTVFVDFS